MNKIDEKLDQWIYNSKVRAEVRKVIEDYVFDEKAKAFTAGWIKCDQHQGITPITNQIRIPTDNIIK